MRREFFDGVFEITQSFVKSLFVSFEIFCRLSITRTIEHSCFSHFSQTLLTCQSWRVLKLLSAKMSRRLKLHVLFLVLWQKLDTLITIKYQLSRKRKIDSTGNNSEKIENLSEWVKVTANEVREIWLNIFSRSSSLSSWNCSKYAGNKAAPTRLQLCRVKVNCDKNVKLSWLM